MRKRQISCLLAEGNAVMRLHWGKKNWDYYALGRQRVLLGGKKRGTAPSCIFKPTQRVRVKYAKKETDNY